MRSASWAGDGGRGSRRASASGVLGAGVLSELLGGLAFAVNNPTPPPLPLSELLSSWRVVVGVSGQPSIDAQVHGEGENLRRIALLHRRPTGLPSRSNHLLRLPPDHQLRRSPGFALHGTRRDPLVVGLEGWVCGEGALVGAEVLFEGDFEVGFQEVFVAWGCRQLGRAGDGVGA